MYHAFPADFCRCDNVLRINCVSHPDHKKSDAFIIALNGRFMLHDGGMKGATDALERLLALREVCCPGGVLHFDWFISHYHIDHVCAVTESILRDGRFCVDTVILPPHNALPADMTHGDSKYSPQIELALREYHPNVKRIEVPYYSDSPVTMLWDFAGAEIEILPPDTDWARPRELYELIAHGYFDTDDIYEPKVPTSVGNAASVWFIIRHGGRRVLFTGDSMKRTREIEEESVDRMYALYRDKIGSPDIAKWPHHGMARDNADLVMHAMDPEYIITTTSVESASVRYNEVFPENRSRFYNCSERDLIFSVGADGEIEVSGGTEGINRGEYYVMSERKK